MSRAASLDRVDDCARWRRWHALPVVLSAIVLAAMWQGGGSLYFGPADSDLTNQFYPWRAFVCRWLQRGVYPFWDPQVFGGYPVVEMQQMSLLNPVSLLTAWLPPRAGLMAMMSAHVVLALVGTCWATGVCLGMSAPAACVAGACYVFGAVFTLRVVAGHFTVVAAMAFIPLALFPLAAVMRSGSLPETTRMLFRPAGLRAVARAAIDSRQWLLLSAVACALTVLAGSPQYVVYLFWMQVALVAALGGRTRTIPALVLLAGVWLLALAIAMPQWLPTLFYLPYTGRAAGSTRLFVGRGDRVSLLLELLLPFPLGDDVRFPHLHFKNVWETGSYPGAITLVLSACLVVRLLRRDAPAGDAARVGLALTALGFYLCMGGWLPGFAGFREAAKARAILALGLPLCAGACIERLRAAADRRIVLEQVFFCVAAAAAGLLGMAARLWPAEFARALLRFGSPFDPAAGAAWSRAARDSAYAVGPFVTACATVALACAAAAVLGAARWRRAAMPWLVMLCCIEPFAIHIHCFRSRHPFDAVELPREFVNYVKDRIACSGTDIWRTSMPAQFANRAHLLEGLCETGGYDPLMPASANTRNVLHGMSVRDPGADRDATVSRALGRRYDFSAWKPQTGEQFTAATVREYEGAGLASIETAVQLAPEQAEAAFGPSFDGVHFVRPPGRPDEMLLQIVDGAGQTSAAVSRVVPLARPQQSPNRYEFRVALQQPALLVVRTTWLPGWRVRVDGSAPAPPLLANGWMLAQPLPAGGHDVLFQYRPPWFRTSLAVSLLACLVALGLLRRQQRPGWNQTS